MPSLDYEGEIEFTCECERCGKELNADVRKGRYGAVIIKVAECEDCIDEAVDKALKEAE